MGKSSGGFGAMITPMLRPDLFGALATHAGDALYEYGYITDFPKCVRLLRDYDGDIWRWWEDFSSRVSFTKEADEHLLMLLGVAACFSAREDGERGLAVRPAHRGAAARGVAALAGLGSGPDGAQVRRRAPVAAGDLDRRGQPGRFLPRPGRGRRSGRRCTISAWVRDVVRFELFDATHAGIDYRYPLSLAWLCQRIAS